jgi:hypothetical protein
MAYGFSRKDLPHNLQDPSLSVTQIGNIYLPPEDYDPENPNNDYILEKPIRALYVGIEGSVTVYTINGSVATFLAVPAGTILPVVVVGFSRLGTSAGELVGMH